MGRSSQLDSKHQTATLDMSATADTTPKRRRTSDFVINPGLTMPQTIPRMVSTLDLFETQMKNKNANLF